MMYSKIFRTAITAFVLVLSSVGRARQSPSFEISWIIRKRLLHTSHADRSMLAPIQRKALNKISFEQDNVLRCSRFSFNNLEQCVIHSLVSAKWNEKVAKQVRLTVPDIFSPMGGVLVFIRIYSPDMEYMISYITVLSLISHVHVSMEG